MSIKKETTQNTEELQDEKLKEVAGGLPIFPPITFGETPDDQKQKTK